MHLENQALSRLVRSQRGPFVVARLCALGFVATLLLVAPRASGDEPPAPVSGNEAAPPAATAAGHAAGISEAERDRQAEAISRSVMSPFCPGRTVSSCPNAGPWREDIRKWVGEGVDAAEIRRRLAARVPEHNLDGVPGNRLGWVLPVGLGVGALGLLVFMLRYLVSRPAVASGSAPDKAAPAKPGGAEAKSNGPADEAGANETAPAGATKNGKDWDAQLDRELETLEN